MTLFFSRAIIVISFGVLSLAYASPAEELSSYCSQFGGEVVTMQAEFSTKHGIVKGLKKNFCQFHVDNGTQVIGLETFSSSKSNIAATYAKTLRPIGQDSDLWVGKSTNPSHNVCRNLGGSAIGFFSHGGFADTLGQSDVCVFGDTSMISAWTLIYMANHRASYDEIKRLIKSVPLL